MKSLEETIHALHLCTSKETACPEDVCPYFGSGGYCHFNVDCDALAHLKEYQKLMKRGAFEGNTLVKPEKLCENFAVWLEDLDKPETVPAVIMQACPGEDVIVAVKRKDSVQLLPLELKEYGARWRAWAKEPVRGEMEAMPWIL